jgi:VCBS repeat-containing protein
MMRPRGFFAALIFGLLFVLPGVAQAANSEFRVLLDVDHDAASGCTISGMAGVDQIFTTRVTTTDTAASVTRTVRQVCTTAGFGPIIDIETGGWPAGFQPASGNVTIETRIPFSAFASTSLPSDMRIGIEGSQGTAVHTAIVRPDGSAVIYPGPRPGKRRSVGSPGSPRVIVLDGLDHDWSGLSPLLTGIAASGSPSLRIIKVTAFTDNANDQLYFLFHVNVSNDAPFATDDSFPRPAGEGLAVPAPGVLENDGDPSGLPLTAMPVSPATRGTVALNPDGSFTYTPNDPSSTEPDTFEYKASNGTKESNTATVTIPVESAGNDDPNITSPSVRTVQENTTAAGALTATDPDGDTLTFSISGGADAGHFSIVGGNLVFNSAPDFEIPTDADGNNQYLVEVTVSDGNGGADVQNITVTVTNANEEGTFTSGNTANVPENTTAVMTVTVDDPDGDDITFSIVSGGDGARFDIDSGSGELTFNPAPNFEAPTDGNSDNQYTVTVRATDGANPITMTITVTVTNVNEAPAFTSPNAASVPENTTAVMTVAAGDPEGGAVTYSITGGADQAFFSINATTGALTFITGRDFESPADANANNQYLVQVTANDGSNNAVQSIAVTVTDANETPAFTSGNAANVPENTTAVMTATASDPEGNALTFSITGGADAADFTINPTTGALSFGTAPNFEAPADADTNNVYLVQLSVTDGTFTVNTTVTVTVTDANESPLFTSGDFTTPENTTAIGTVTTTDPEGNAVTYSITGGADQAFFSINATTGVLTFTAARDFEAPADANADNVYLVQVTANDGASNSVQNVAVTVTDVNEAPAFTSSSTVNVPENTTVVQTVAADDPEGSALTYSISGGADAALFSINATTGALTFNAAPNFEAPADADANNQYLVQVTATDGTNPVNQVVTVTVTNQNDAPVVSSGNAFAVPENTTAVATVTGTDEDGNALTFSISGGADAALFSINSTTGALSFNAAPNFEAPADAGANNVYDVQVTVNDGTASANQAIAVTVTNVNEAPAFTSSTTASVAENTTAIMTVVATDPEAATVTYSLTGGADQAFFSIDTNTGALTFITGRDFETPADADANNTYIVQVTANDGVLNTPQTITVTVTNANEAPAITSPNTATVPENTLTAATVTATDPEGVTITYSITGDADQALFSIDGSTGVLTFNAPPDFENPADADSNNQYVVQVTASDGTNSTNQTLTVTVTDVNEAPSITSSNTASVVENTTAVLTATATDPESNTITWSITGGADAADFSIDTNTGALTFASAPDFEAPADADTNNSYIVEVTANDGTNNTAQTITVTVTDDNEAPSITSANTFNVDENTTAVSTLTSSDPESDTITWSITGGADAGAFTINTSTGALSFLAAPNFEAPADADTNNQYVVQVTATDGEFPVNQTITVTVTDVNEAPSITSSNAASVPENSTAVTTVTTTDPEGNTVTYSITGGADAALFAIDTNTGALTFLAAPDFEAPADADTNNTYLVQVTANDGTNNTVQTITVTVTDVNEAPAITSSASPSVAENTTAVLTVTSSDPESNTVTYSITGGADAALFGIVSGTGVLTFNSAPNFEAPADADTNNTYIVEVTANDGTNNTPQTITVTVTDVNEGPSITSANTASVAENTTAVTTVTTTDPETDTITYSITGGADAALFSIDSNTGALTFNAGPNFEAPADANADNAYVVEVSATDGTTPATQTITVTVTNVNEAPSFTSSATPSTVENTTSVVTVTASDPENDTVTYSITGGADQAFFSIDTNTGVLTFLSAPDFEAPGDAGANNVYDVQVTVTDGSFPVAQNIAVTVTDANEAPSFTSANTNSVPENTLTAHTVTTSDPENDTITYSVTGGADQADFSIDANTGVLSFLVNPDFEAPHDADTNNTYVVQVTATDGTNPINQTITITVTAVNEAPAFTSANTANVPENTTAVTTVTTTDPEGNTVTYSVTGGADMGDFTIDTNTGALSFLVAPDFEAPADADADNVYIVQVTANDGTNNAVQTISVSVINGNEAPVFTSSATPSVPENQTAVITVTTTDVENDPRTYTITGGADPAFFSIGLNDGVLTFNSAPNFEAPGDAGANNVYDVQVTADDGALTTVQNLTVTVTNVNEAPVYSSGTSFTQAENITAVTTVAASDPEGVAVTYSVTGGADQAKFTIVAGTGALSFITAPDFDIPGDANADNVYQVQVTATDGVNPVVQSISVTITNVNEGPVFSSSATPSVPENMTTAVDVNAADPEGVAVTYSIVGGADQALFSIDSNTGVLSFLSAPNFEAPGDADTNNIYLVNVQATDGSMPMTQNLTVTVTNVNEAPSITTANTANTAENTTAVIDVDATDPDAATTLTYSISGGADQAKFSIVSGTGVLTFLSAPDFENPTDVGANNVYDVTVQVTDGVNPVTQAIAVTVTNVDEAPAFTSANTANVNENTTAVVDVDATDPEGAAVTYSIVGGADQGDFSIDSGSGVLTFNPAPNFEAPADADTNNIYIVQVQASAGAVPATQTITVTVINVNEAPVNSVPGAQTFNEDVNRIFSSGNGNQISISDPDAGANPVQVTLTATNGTLSTNGVAGLTFTPANASNDGVDDATLTFTGTITNINAALNGLTYKPALNYYGAATVAITTNDQGNTGTGGAQSTGPTSIALTISPVNDAPTAEAKLHVTHSGIGLTISAASHTGELKENAADVDDHDPFSELTVQIVGGSVSPVGSTVTLIDANDGSFYFEPRGGVSGNGSASFQYQVCDNGDVGLGLAPACSSATTVTFNITGPDLWFVDDTDAAGCGVNCNGSRTKPLVGLNNANVNFTGRGTADKIFVFSGTYNHGHTMAVSELLVGQASSGTFDAVLGVSVPGNGTLDTRPTLSGAAATLQNTLTAANSTTVRGISISSGANKGYVASANTLTVLESSVTAANTAVELTNATTSSISFTSTTSTGGTHGINLSNVSGTFAFGSGGLSNNTTAGFRLVNASGGTNVSTITYSGLIQPTAAGRAVSIGTADGNSGANASNGLEGASVVTLSGNMTGGISVFESSGGTLNLGGTHTHNTGANSALDLVDNDGTTFNFTAGTMALTTVNGNGINATDGGTLNITGDDNTISTTGSGRAINFAGTSAAAKMAGTLRFKTVNKSGSGTKGIVVNNHSGSFAITGDDDNNGTPDSVTAGGTITGTSARGAEFVAVDGGVSLGGMTFTNTVTTDAGSEAICGSDLIGNDNTVCNAAIHLQTIEPSTTLRTISVNGSTQTGINGYSLRALTMNGVTVQNVGSAGIAEHGATLKNLLGTNVITGSTFTNNAGRGLYIINTASEATDPTVSITSSQFNNSGSLQGALFDSYNSGDYTVNVGDDTVGGANTFSGNFSNALQQSVGLGGDMTINVKRNTFNHTVSGIVLQAAGVGSTSNLNYTIWNNTVVKTNGSAAAGSGAIIVSGTQQHQISGDIRSNTIGNGAAGSGAYCGGGCNGITVDHNDISAGGGGRHDVTIVGNDVRNVDSSGIRVLIGQKSRGNVVVTGNRVRDPHNAGGVTTFSGIYVQGGIIAADTSCLAATIGGTTNPGAWPSTSANAMNSVEGSWDPLGSQSEIFIWRKGGTLNVPGSSAPVATYVAARNNIPDATGADVTELGAIGSAATCP